MQWWAWASPTFGSAACVYSSGVYTGIRCGQSSGTWVYQMPPFLMNDTSYQIHVRVTDRGGELAYSVTNFFTVDVTSPASAATFPTGSPQSVNTIAGTASDTAPGELMITGGVQIRIVRADTNEVFNGAAFVATGGDPANSIGCLPVTSVVWWAAQLILELLVAAGKSGRTKLTACWRAQGTRPGTGTIFRTTNRLTVRTRARLNLHFQNLRRM